MFQHLFLMELKNLRRSKLYWGYLVVNLLIYGMNVYATLTISAANSYFLLYSILYFELILFVSNFAFASFVAAKENRIAELCFADRGNAFLAKYLACFLLELPLCLYPFLHNLIGGIAQSLSFTYTVTAIADHTLRCLVMALVSHTLGFALGYLLKNVLTVLLSIPLVCLFSFVNSFLFQYLGLEEDSNWCNLLSINKMFSLSGTKIIYIGPTMGLLFWVKNAVLVLGSLALALAVAGLFKRRNKALLLSFSAGATVLCLVCGFSFFRLFPRKYDYVQQSVLYPQSRSATQDQVVSCRGTVELGEWSSFALDLEVQDQNQDGAFSFALDPCFKISSLQQGGKSVSYKREGQTVTCKLQADQAGPIALSLHYKGRPYYATDYRNADIFSGTKSAMLPVGFAFLPLTGAEEATAYDLTVYAKNTVLSNLDQAADWMDPGNTLTKKAYHFQGESRTVALFCGYFSSFEKDGITVYHAKYDSLTDYEDKAEVALSLRKRNYLGNGSEVLMEWEEGERESCDKMFLINYYCNSCGFPCVFDGCIYRECGTDLQ